MALSKGKARGRRGEKRRIAEQIPGRSTHSRIEPTRRKRANTPRRRQPYDSVSLPQLVYELLAIDKYNQDVGGRFRKRFRTPRRRIQRHRKRQRFPYETADHRDSPESIEVSECAMESRPTSIESLAEPMDAANSSAPTSSANSSMSNISMEPITLAKSLNSARALFRKKSLVQLINSYVKAGVEEGKRRAKKYIRKALSFGVRSGYLIPTDPQGNVLRVCSTLDTGSCRKPDAESRRSRRIARRGETRLTIDDRKAMRRGILRDRSRQDVTSRRRQERHSVQSPAGNLSTREGSPRKSPQKSTLRAKNKPKTDTRRKRGIEDTVRNKQRQQRKRRDRRDIKKPVKRRRTVLSPTRAENDREPVEESYQDVGSRDHDQYKSNEDNYTAIAERRKSMSRENGSRAEKGTVETNIEDNRDGTERRNINDDDDDDEKSEEASVERDASDMIRELNT
ncbi:hypothetical protein DMN91_013022 [Ooceraea biroi]|uniref:Uncharacterized protein n=1 Tax=Ooceraea biroi TaxID=2015173 RepID=A0A3L8D3T9_OOCBI|nr:hypothetical protein DMN91_013022 [Ooceraea biroi]